MRKLIIPLLLLSLTGCATTDYRVNGVEPKKDNTLQILGTIVVLGAVASAISPNKGKEACKSYISTGLISQPTVVTTYQTKCP
jgi:ABC-type Zn uptake system ZnuABC Zn-binding protein ZnuA